MNTRVVSKNQSSERLPDTALVKVQAPPLALTDPENAKDTQQTVPVADGPKLGYPASSSWTPEMLAAEKQRLVDYLDKTVAVHGTVHSSRAQPGSPFIALIAKESGVRLSQISPKDGPLRDVLDCFIERYGLKPFDGPCGPLCVPKTLSELLT